MKTPKRSLFVFLALLVVSLLAFNAHAARKKNSAARETVRQNAPHPPITIASAAPNCTLPGVTVVSDPTGDENTMVGSSKQDIQSVSIAELGTDTNKLTFTMKVADLSGTLPPNATWRIYFTGANSTLYWVSMLTDATSTVTFTYGTRSGSLDSGVGAADAGDFAADGTIHIKIANSKVGNPTAGQTLTAIFARTYTLVGAAGSGLLVTIDDETNQTGTKQYTLIGNTACAAATPAPGRAVHRC